MQKRRLGNTGIEISPLVLGGNVFGWTTDKETSFAVLDAALAAGINTIDTADVYMKYAPGNKGGESETMIGEWMKDRGVRDQVILITKGGLPMGEGMQGLSRDYLTSACEASLQRLQTDYVEVYMAHRPDPATPIADTLETFQALIDAGKVGHAAGSNYTPAELREALALAGNGKARYAVIEPQYNLVARDEFEGELEAVSVENDLGVIPYYALAAGFLTGKYRSEADLEGKTRGGSVKGFMTPANLALLDRMERIAKSHDATMAQVALAWLLARPSVSAPIVSATSVAQLNDILKSAELELSAEDLAELNG